MRKRLYEIIEVSKNNDKASMAYDIVMMCAIAVSIVPLALKKLIVFFIIQIFSRLFYLSSIMYLG